MFKLSCITTNDIIRYNPFYDILENQDDRFFENEPTEYIQSIQEFSETLENCKSYSKSQFNELMANNLNQKHKGQAQNLLFSTYFLNIDGNKTNFDRLSPELAVSKHKFSVVALAEGQAQNLIFSTYFLNIDGNKTNFDRRSAELAVIKHKFSVVALAETNTDECNKDLYKLSNEYTPVYSSKIENKVKGSGVALYVKNGFSFNILNELSSCDKNIETLFIKITNTSAPIVIGVVYRPPSGDIDEFN